MQQELFVYGTLLPGLCRHGAMQGAQWLGQAWVQGALFDLGDYPGLRLEGATGPVWGQLAGVDDALLQRLDAIEAYDPAHPEASEYRRERVWAHRTQGETRLVWTYVYARECQHLPRIAHGDYWRYVQETGFVPRLAPGERMGDAGLCA
jgi:gamma-glutamylcyclotransferase (GGCT)/AIG2-like uncharacterized protein YtfP